MLLHIPHASIEFPAGYQHSFPVDEIKEHTDWFTDHLFSAGVQFVYPFSRYYLDVERLDGDPLEANGRGMIYTRSVSGDLVRVVGDDEAAALRGEYLEWRRSMRREAEKQTSMLDRVVVVDCHSFSARQIGMSENDVPDVCIGFNEDDSRPSAALLEAVRKRFVDRGYTVAFNSPYGNAIRVSEYPGIYSLMLEINKRTYLTADYTKSAGYARMKTGIAEAISVISDFELGGES